MNDLRLALSTVADEAGAAAIRVGPPPGGYEWLITSVTVATSAGIPCPCTLWLGEPQDNRPITASTLGNQDTAAGSPPVTLQDTDHLTVTWQGAGPGATCTAFVLGIISPQSLPSRPLLA